MIGVFGRLEYLHGSLAGKEMAALVAAATVSSQSMNERLN
jgi:hypothetical protein